MIQFDDGRFVFGRDLDGHEGLGVVSIRQAEYVSLNCIPALGLCADPSASACVSRTHYFWYDALMKVLGSLQFSYLDVR
jgi:hypothetical protein